MNMKRSLFSNSYQINQAKAETLRLIYFRLGYCGSDEEVKALTLIVIVAAESFLFTFLRKKCKSHCPARGQESQKRKCLDFLLFRKNVNDKY